MSNRLTVGHATIELTRGDITTETVDMIANAANAHLRGGGGVDGAIHRAAGPGVMAELRRAHPHGTPTGSAVLTGGGRLTARWIAHAVGPVYRGGHLGEATQLADAYRSVLALADERGAVSVAMPAISMGIYGYPAAEGARVALAAVRDHLLAGSRVELVRLVLRGELYAVFAAALAELDGAAAG